MTDIQTNDDRKPPHYLNAKYGRVAETLNSKTPPGLAIHWAAFQQTTR